MSNKETNPTQKVADESDEQRVAAQKAAMREALENVELTPEQTSDDIAPKSREHDYLADVPPHHGGH